MTPQDPNPSALWPLRDLRVVSGDLELRYLDDALLFELAELAGQGVHAPDAMPFEFPWSVGTPQEVGRSVLTYQWSARGKTSAAAWTIELAVLRDGIPLGFQGVGSTDFLVTRTAETGSWLGLRHQGAGVGTRMRVLILHLLFEGLGAQTATTTAWADNGPSNGVTRKLGYRLNGSTNQARLGLPATQLAYRLDRADWDARPDALRPEVTLHGVDGTREFLQIT